MRELSYLSIEEAHELLISKKVSCKDLVSYYFDRISKLDGDIKSYIVLNQEQALKRAEAVDNKIANGKEIGLLEGIPYSAKDMFSTKDLQTTAASKILEGYIPPFSATAIRKLEDQGAILLGKTNQDEFAHGGSTENSGFFKTTNPWDKTKVPGGSSGGSAAAVAADFCIFSLGTDTGGSIREPASFCGITGYKPTYGLVSRYGVIAMASSFDCIGPLTRSAQDAQIVLRAIAGRDSQDATTIQSKPIDKVNKLHDIVLGVPSEHLATTSVKELINATSHKTIEVELIESMMALAAYYVLVPSEISSNLERYDGVRYGKSSKEASDVTELYTKTRAEYLGEEPKRRILTGTYALSSGYYDAYYKKAMQVRRLIIDKFNVMFENCDVLVTPTTLQTAFEFNSKSDPIEMYKTDLLTVTANLAGLPAISIPAGIDASTKMPLGLQIIGKQGEDNKVLSLANQFQQNTNWHKKVKEIKL